MAYRTTLGWSLLTSGIVTLILEFVLPYPSMYWGVLLIALGAVTLYVRQW